MKTLSISLRLWLTLAVLALMPANSLASVAKSEIQLASVAKSEIRNLKSEIRNPQSAIQQSGVYIETFTSYAAKDYTDNAEWDIWQHELRMTRTDGAADFPPLVATDGDGNSFVLWYVNGKLYFQKLDARGNKLWEHQVGLYYKGEHPTHMMTPALAVDKNGNAVIVWQDSRSSNEDVYAQKLDANGVCQWSDGGVRVNSDSGTANQYLPDVSIDGSGNVLVAWYDNRNGNLDIYAQKLDPSGARQWAADARVNSDSGTASQEAVGVAADASGNAVIVWQDDRNGNWDIYAQKLDASGSPSWGADVRVNSDSGTASQEKPDVAVDSGGRAIVIWEDARSGQWDAYAQALGATGAKQWPTDVQVNSGTRHIDYGGRPGHWLAVAIDRSNQAIVAWGSDHNVYAQKLDASGARRWASDVRVNSNSWIGTIPNPAVAVGGSGPIVIVWFDLRNGSADVYAQALESDGRHAWGADVRVNDDNGLAEQSFPDIAVNGNGQVLAVWQDSRNNNLDIYATALGTTGNKLWSADVRVNSDSGTTHQAKPAVAMDGNGNAIVAWQGDHVYAQKLDLNGNKLWATDVTVGGGAVNEAKVDVAVDGNGSTIVVWQGDSVYAQKLDANGHKQWTAAMPLGPANSRNPAVAVDGNGNAIVIWQQNNGGNVDVYARKLTTGGNIQWAADVRVNSASGTADLRTDVSADTNGNAYVVWQDGRDCVYAQRLDANGNRLWSADVRVNASPGSFTGWRYVAVNVDGSGNAVVVWQEDRNHDGGDETYIQKLDTAGNKLWVTAAQASVGRTPVLGIDGSGYAVVAGVSNRNSPSSNIYAQKIELAAGNRAWTSDVQVSTPGPFYFHTGTAQSLQVNPVTGTLAITGNIQQATLAADYALNGGSVQFSLTNDGGAHWFAVQPNVTHVFTTTGSDLRWKAVLNADPLWPRAPVVYSLRIECTTEGGGFFGSDAYEPDETYVQARPIAVNGAAQSHNFDHADDADWVSFDVVSGTTYVVQTSNTQANANTSLALYSNPSTQVGSDDNAFGTDARITWKAALSGTMYLRVTNQPTTTFGADTGYDLSVRTFAQPPVVVIVAGHDNNYTLQANIAYAADMAYRAFTDSGVPANNIRYLAPSASQAQRYAQVTASPTVTNVREAIQDWSRTRGVGLGVPFYLYLVNHGGVDQFLADGSGGKLTATDLNLWLSNLEATSGADNVNVIVEACKSGSFVDVTADGPASISGHNRVVIASTSSGLNAFPSAQGAYFSDTFWTAVGQNKDLKTAFDWARQAVQATGMSQSPWLDDNGDALANSQDGALARGRGLGSAFAGSPPVIDWVQADPCEGCGTFARVIRAQVRDDLGVSQVWAVIYPPNFVEPPPSPDGTMPVVNVPTTTLTLAGNDLFTTTYTAFTQTGQYRLVVYAQDADGNQALPQSALACVGCSYTYLPLILSGR